MRTTGRSGHRSRKQVVQRDAGAPTPRTPLDRGAPLAVRLYEPGDEDALVEIFSATFHQRSLTEWNWLFGRIDGGPAQVDVRVLTSGDRVVGSVSHVGTDAWVAGRRLRLAMGADMIVIPECRGRGGAEALVTSFLASDHGFDMNFGVVNSGSRHVTKRYMGTRVVGFVPVWTRAGRAGAASHTGRTRRLGDRLRRAYASLAARPRPRLPVVDLVAPDAAVDALAGDSARFATAIRVRDARYLQWHWLNDPRTQWRIRAVWGEPGVLRGYAVSATRDEDGVRHGVIADVLARDGRALRALVLDAWERLAADGAETVVCRYRDPRPWARIAMLRAGFTRTLRPGPRIACGPLSDRAGELVSRRRSWYLTTADTDL